MRWNLPRGLFGNDGAQAPWARAIAKERYAALRHQVPVTYLLAVVNLAALQITTSGQLALGWNLPTFFLICAALRSYQWLRTPETISFERMQSRMRQTSILATALCVAVCIWCLSLLETARPETHMAIVLYGALTAVGVAYGLSAIPWAACMPLLVIALPLASVSFISPNPQFIGASLSLLVVILLVFRLLLITNRQFTDLVRSRSLISSERREADLARQEALLAATTDFLTGLPNRRAFVGALQAATGHVAAAVVDLNHFKAMNDTFGHAFGDEVLRTVARRLVEAVGEGGCVARLGGDEFGLLFADVATPEEAEARGRRVLSEVNRPALIDGRQILIQASCGVGMSRPEQTSLRLLADADIALYDAKSQPSAPLALFQPEMEAPRRRRVEIERALQEQKAHEEIGQVFQPIVDLRSGDIVAHEALARWNHERLGEVRPSEFIPIAEQLRLIDGLGEHLLAKALAEAATWPASVRLSFNLSAVQLSSECLASSVLTALKAAGVTPDRLQVEVTETALLVNFDRARSNLTKLRKAGVVIALDDFGAGYASIGYLREICFDQVKLDGALVTAATQGADGERLLGAVIGLCRALDLTPIAEHVEDDLQRQLLLKLGCRFGQGFRLQPPMAAEEARSAAIQLCPEPRAGRSGDRLHAA